jgi:glucose-6-phosphate 1-epimerase
MSQEQDHSIAGFAVVERDGYGLERIAVTTADAEAEIYLQGAHVTRFQPNGRGSLLFLSEKSIFQPGKAIRGGVPIVFPWFGPSAADPKLPAHGFARTTRWDLSAISRRGDRALIELALKASEATRKLWPHDFELRFRVTVGTTLQMQLEVRNAGGTDFSFEEALHTYLAVKDVRQVAIGGLAGLEYLDKVQGGKRIREGAQPIRITGETDRVYLATPDAVIVDDPAASRRLRVEKESSNATVVWNPWIAKAQALSDFGDDEWPAMLCVESANVGEIAVTLRPGEVHTLCATVAVD